MTHHTTRRTTVPLWVRQLERDELHALAYKLRRDFMEGGISERQDWLLDRCFAELDFRSTHPDLFGRCWCDLCVPPREWGDWDRLEPLDELGDPF